MRTKFPVSAFAKTFPLTKYEYAIFHGHFDGRRRQPFRDHGLAFEIRLAFFRLFIVELTGQRVERLVQLFRIRRRDAAAIGHHRDERAGRRFLDARIARLEIGRAHV